MVHAWGRGVVRCSRSTSFRSNTADNPADEGPDTNPEVLPADYRTLCRRHRPGREHGRTRRKFEVRSRSPNANHNCATGLVGQCLMLCIPEGP